MRSLVALGPVWLSWDGTCDPSPARREPGRRPSPRRRWARYGLAGVVLLAVAIVAGPFVFFHFVEGSAPPPLALPRGRSAAGAGANGPLGGTWQVAKGSRAEYRVHEFLFGQSGVAVGSTQDVTGTVIVRGTTVAQATVTVDMRTVTTNMAGRNIMFHDAIMDTATYPYGKFTLAKPIHLGTLPADGRAVDVLAVGRLELRGDSRPVSFPLRAEREGNEVVVDGSLQIRFGLWHIPNPSFAVAKVGNTGTVEVLLYLEKSSASTKS